MGTKEKKKEKPQGAVSGFLWMATSSSAQAILRMALMLVLARLLLPADFGLITIATMVTGFAELFIQLGVGPALVQTKELTDKHISTGFTFSIINGFGMALLFLWINPLLAQFFKMPLLTGVLNKMIWIFPLRMVSKISYSLLQRELKFKKLAGNEVISYMVAYGFVGVPMAYMGYGYMALVWATMLENIIYSAILFYHQPHKLTLGIDFKILKQLLGFGKHYTSSIIFNYMAQQGDYFVIGRVMDATAVGIYSRAYRLMNMSNTMLGSVMQSVLFPKFAKIQNDRELTTQALNRSFAVVFMVFIPISGICLIAAPEIVHVLFGHGWDATIPIFQVFTFGMTLRIAFKIGGSFTSGQGLVKKNSKIQILYFLNVLIGAYIGSFWGLTWVAVFITIALLINFILLTNLAVKYSDYTWNKLVTDLVHQLAFNVPVLFIVYLLVYQARVLHVPDALVIIIAMASWAALLAVVVKFNSRLWLGNNNGWARASFLSKIIFFRVLLK